MQGRQLLVEHGEAQLFPLAVWRVQEGSQEEMTPGLKPELQLASWNMDSGAPGRRYHVSKGMEASPWHHLWGDLHPKVSDPRQGWR